MAVRRNTVIVTEDTEKSVKPTGRRGRGKTQDSNGARTSRRQGAAWKEKREITDQAGGVVATLYLGDCRDVMGALGQSGVHAVVTDPPYELEFMGAAWDRVNGPASNAATWQLAAAMLRPGGYVVSFAGSRTYHKIATAIEAADLEIRDQLMWLYGNGFPKSHDVAKAIDKATGIWRGRAGAVKRHVSSRSFGAHYVTTKKGSAVTDAAREWDVWGTALRPAHEPIVLARKRFRGTVAANCMVRATGALNISGCREGPWPANVLCDGSAGVQLSLAAHSRGAAPWFYAPKASRLEREAGLDVRGGASIAPRAAFDRGCARRSLNTHPTVKPVSVMRWLSRLVTAPSGVVLDPFMGSGTTGVAAACEGMKFVGIEQDARFFELAQQRIAHAVRAVDEQPDLVRAIERAVAAASESQTAMW